LAFVSIARGNENQGNFEKRREFFDLSGHGMIRTESGMIDHGYHRNDR
jgi:hypothetical protein